MSDEIDKLLAKSDFDAADFDELAEMLDSKAVPGLIGIEGTPFAGKSTLTARLALNLKACVIPEHTDIDLHAQELALSAWSDNSEAAASRQDYFYLVEKHRTKLALEALSQGLPVVMDRTVLSVVVYSLARGATSKNLSTSELINTEILKDSDICFPGVLHLLQVPTSTLLERAKRLADVGMPRAIEPFLLHPSTLELLNFFYTSITSRFKRCDVIVKSSLS